MNQKHVIKRSALHRCIHIFLINRTDPESKIQRKKLRNILGVSFHIPKEEKEKVIKELQDYKIIIYNSKSGFKINKKIR